VIDPGWIPQEALIRSEASGSGTHKAILHVDRGRHRFAPRGSSDVLRKHECASGLKDRPIRPIRPLGQMYVFVQRGRLEVNVAVSKNFFETEPQQTSRTPCRMLTIVLTRAPLAMCCLTIYFAVDCKGGGDLYGQLS
jgi:hypothetical protein